MDKVLQTILHIQSLFTIATQIISTAKDTGRQAIQAAVLKDVGARVAAGQLPKSLGEVAGSLVEDVLNAHPLAPGNGEKPVDPPQVVTPSPSPNGPARNFTDADLAALASLMKGAQ